MLGLQSLEEVSEAIQMKEMPMTVAFHRIFFSVVIQNIKSLVFHEWSGWRELHPKVRQGHGSQIKLKSFVTPDLRGSLHNLHIQGMC